MVAESMPLLVAQFNVLADGLCAKAKGGGGFTESPPESLVWEYRGRRVMEELLRHGRLPDVVGLQEVDHYSEIEPIMRRLGYEGSFLPKPNSRCKRSLDPSLEDGCALFWRAGLVEKVDIETMNYERLDEDGLPTGKKDNQVAILATLRPLGGKPLVVAVTHLIAAKSQKGETHRTQQLRQLLDRVHEKALPCILVMDMNAAPMRNPAADYPSEAYPAALQHALGLRSAYFEALGSEPTYTTWKRRGEKEAKHTIDYIMYSRGISVLEVLMPPEERHVVPERLPGWAYPSDHVALMATLFVPKE